MEFKIKANDYQYRVKKLNVIEVLAIKANLLTDNIDDTTKLFNEILERIEVNVQNQWISVKEKNLDILTPACLSDDINAIKEIIDVFISKYLKTVFTKSNGSNQ